MKKSTLLAEALSPEGEKFSLFERDGEYTIRVGGLDLMSTRQHASEEKLAELACAHIAQAPQARVLIGGLGFGFTLKAVLAAVAPTATVVVAELMPAIVEWNRHPDYQLAAAALNDPRVSVVLGDVGELIKRHPGSFDAIILDVDNGPEALSAAVNASLYHRSGLLHTKAALRPGGCVGYWSAAPDKGFAKLLERVGYRVEVQSARAHGSSGSWHTLFMGWRL